jgi:hypothetical protein
MEKNNEEAKKRGIPKGTQIKRSNAYPSITIQKSLEIADAVYKNAGNGYLSGEQIAKVLNKNFNSITQKLGSCVQYGLLDLKSKVGYKPAEICKRIFRPINEEEKRKALIECFGNPKLYAELIPKYENNHLPTQQVLANVLDRHHNVYDDAAQKASEVFFENLTDLNLISPKNELVFNGYSDAPNSASNPVEVNEEDQDEISQEKNSPVSKAGKRIEEKMTNEVLQTSSHYKTDIPLTEGRKAVLFYPSDINENDLQLLKGQIDLLGLYIKLNTGSPKND